MDIHHIGLSQNESVIGFLVVLFPICRILLLIGFYDVS